MIMNLPVIAVETVIVGGGPAGLAPLLSASRTGSLEKILSGGVAIIECGPAIGAGNIGKYAITADSTAETIVSGIFESLHPRLAELRDHPATQAVAAHGTGSVPLAMVGAFMAVVGAALHDILAASPSSSVMIGHEALNTRQREDGMWQTEVRRANDGATQTILSRFVVLATGGHQPTSRLENYEVAGEGLLPRYADKLVQSDEALTPTGLAAIGCRLAESRNRHVAIIGSSSSAMGGARALMRIEHEQGFGADVVTVLHRRRLRIFYLSAADALADGYDEFGPDDICPISGFVFRFAGFRLDTREFAMGALGIGGRLADPRLRLHRLTRGFDPKAAAILDDADVIVAALGYRPRALPVLTASGNLIPLHSAGSAENPLVDDQCCVLDAAGDPIDGLLAIGLATGFISPKAAGGEPSFFGQTNGLWQWQHDVGAIIAKHLEEKALLPLFSSGRTCAGWFESARAG
jgi:hypothetical protein